MSSKEEAELKNAEVDSQIKKEALEAAQIIDEYVKNKSTIQKANQEAQRKYEVEVKAEDERVSKLEAESAKDNSANKEAQLAYDAEKSKVDALNAEALKTYEAEKSKVEAQNAESLKTYEAEKSKVEAQNAEKLRTYESELESTKVENAKILAQYESELEKAKIAKKTSDDDAARIKAENDKAQKEYEAELARVTAERDELTKQYERDKARIEKENQDAQLSTQANAKQIEDDYQTALAAYNKKVEEITKQNKESQDAYETAKQAVEAKNAKIESDYLIAKKAYDDKLAEVTASNKAKQDAYNKALADYNAGKLDTVTNKEKTLSMNLPNVPANVTVNTPRTIEKDLTNSTNVTADLKAAEDEFRAEEANVTTKLNELANTPVEQPVDPGARSLVATELKSAQDWAARQNELGKQIGVRYVIKERLVTGNDATVESLKAAYNKAKAQMDADALVSQHFSSATKPAGYDWIGSKNRFIQKWADIKQTYANYLAAQDAAEAAKVGKTVKTVELDLTALPGYDRASKSTATGEVNATAGTPTEVTEWGDSYTNKRKELGAVLTTNTPGVTKFEIVDPETYKAKVAEFNRNLPTIQSSVDAFNTERKNNLAHLLAGDLNSSLGSSNSGKRVINNNNMTFTKSSDRVQYLRSQNFSTLEDAMHKGFDIANDANTNSATPVENQLAKVKFTAVRIPKGESVTVEYTRKDGKEYLGTGDLLRDTMFVRNSEYANKDTFTRTDEQGLQKIRYTIRNDGSISSDGDLIAFFMNDTAIPAYFGISNMGSPEGSNRFKLLPDSRQTFGTTTTTEFLNNGNELLRATVRKLEVKYPDQTDPSTFNLSYGNQFVKGNLPSVDTAPVKELVSRPDSGATINEHGVTFGNSLVPVEKLSNLATNWKDTESWASVQTGWDGAKLINHQKSFNKDHVTKAVAPDSGRYQVSEVETGFYNAARYRNIGEPARPVFPYQSSEAKYASGKPVGEHVHVIEVPVVRGPNAATAPREITPVKMVIRYKEVTKGVVPTQPTLEQLPTEPIKATKDPLPTAPNKTPLPDRPIKGQVAPAQTKPLPNEPKLPELPKKPVPKSVVDNVSTEPKKPELKKEPIKPPLTEVPKKPELLAIPKKPNPKEYPTPPVLKEVKKVVRREIEKPTLQDEPKVPELKLSKVRYVYEPKTIWETVDGKVLRSWEDGEKSKDNFNGYEYVRTDKDKDGNIHHIYKPVEQPKEQPKMKTIWETVDGKVLRSWEDGEKSKDNFNGYEFVRTDKDKDGNIHHIYKPVEQPKMKTIWETVDGQVLRAWEDGEKSKDNFNGYEYVRIEKDNDGNIHHIYKPISVQKPTNTAKELPNTGDSGIVSSVIGMLFTFGGMLGLNRSKNKK